MAMTKKEQAEMEALRWQVYEACALRFTDPVEPDIPIPEAFGKTINGYLYHVNRTEVRVEKSCTSSGNHSFGSWDKTNSQGARRLYSSELLAMMAARSAMAKECALALAKIDQRIDQMRSPA